MFFFIIAIILIIAFAFFRDKKQETAKVSQQGGMEIKYHYLINNFSNYPNAQINKLSNSSIEIVIRDKFVTTRFTINHGFSDFTVFWDHQSYAFGKHHLNWRFPEYTNQESVYMSIVSDLNKYEKSIFKNYL